MGQQAANVTDDKQFVDLAEGPCGLIKPFTSPDGRKWSMPNFIQLPPHMKNKCAGFCLWKQQENSLGKGFKCWGYTFTNHGTCLIWRQGPLTKGKVHELDVAGHVYNVDRWTKGQR